MRQLLVDDAQQVAFVNGSLRDPSSHAGSADVISFTDRPPEGCFVHMETVRLQKGELRSRIGRQPNRSVHMRSLARCGVRGQVGARQLEHDYGNTGANWTFDASCVSGGVRLKGGMTRFSGVTLK